MPFILSRRSLAAVLALGLTAGLIHAAAPKAAGVDLRLQVARQWEEKGEYDKAVQELRLYLSEHPENPGAIYARIGGLRLKQGNFKLAGENFKIALAKDPALAEARAGLALAYEKLGDKAKAEEERKKLAEMQGAKPAPAASAAPAAGTASAGKGADAPGPATTAKSANDELPPPPGEAISKPTAPTPASPPSAPGDAPVPAAQAVPPHAQIPPESGEGFSPALDSGASQGPTGIYADKDFQAALELYKAGKLDAMAGPLRRCLARHPGHPGAYYLGGVMRYDRGDYAKALFNFKRAQAYPDRGFNSHFYMGRIYQKQERFPQAANEYREYLKATQSPVGRKRAEAYLAQMGEGNAPATLGSHAGEADKTAGAKADGEAPGKAGEKPGPGTEGKAAESGKPGPDLKESTAKEAAHEAGPGEKAPGKGGKGEEDASKVGQPAAPKAPPAPVPPSEAKALVLGRDGGFLFLIPDPASASGKKLNEAHLLVKNDRFEKAVDALKEVMAAYGGSDNALAAGLDLASVYLQLGLWDQARDRAADHLGRAEVPRDSAKFYDAAQYLSALAHLGLKDGGKAEKALLKIKPGAPDGPAQEEVDYRLAQAGALMNDPKKWSGYLEKGFANAKDPVRKAGYARDMGGLHAKYGALDKALGWYGKAAGECKDPRMVLGPDREAMGKDSVLQGLCAEVRLRMADLAYRKKDWKGALAQYRQFASQWPEHKESAWVHYQMANIYKATGNFESALNEYKRVIDNYPDSYWASQAKWKREDAIWRKEYEEVLD